MRKAIFEDDKTTPSDFRSPYTKTNQIELGDLVIAQHLSGVIFDCFVVKDYDKEPLVLRKNEVNVYFYNEVQKAYKKYNDKREIL